MMLIVGGILMEYFFQVCNCKRWLGCRGRTRNVLHQESKAVNVSLATVLV